MLSLLATDASAFFFSSEENKNFSDKTDFLQFCIWVTFDEHADTLTSGCASCDQSVLTVLADKPTEVIEKIRLIFSP